MCDIGGLKTIVFTTAAAKDLDALPPDAREQVADALSRYAISGEGDVKRLSGRGGLRLRVGRYRVIFDEDSRTILAIYVGLRQTTTYRKSEGGRHG
ncbi:plasmid stabilization protein [Terrarubrum flagellatum]|uniref:type II toxin-antitoxin system RelE family toxin n=1 Tax=Terrirubrum flagellatum TaxID=2895980 RepID=UPI003144E6D2